MRFHADGPSIPDELLIARDQGRVILFCGAGVSRAKAKLPDFFGLAEMVTSELGVDDQSPARKLLLESQQFESRVGVAGIVSADRIFGLLEREFDSRDIERAVAGALTPAPECDLSAHRTVLDLATTPEGAVQLVTTNFDLLFELCEPTVQVLQPPRLPDPSRAGELNGVIHLHGIATSNYDGAQGDGFILSSSAFGRAYLSDGWATRFIRSLIDRHIVVFVGYAADDPPVQYLLEALKKPSGTLSNVYAFQSGDANDAATRWQHKGVTAISYGHTDGHSCLWRSLESWAQRAKGPDLWSNNLIELAKHGPETLAPHQRGQVAHLVSTYEGARKFAQGSDVPPAEWLGVFDPARRYAAPGRSENRVFGESSDFIDPFALYGLDGDDPPQKFDPEHRHAKRTVPPNAWSVFSHTRTDVSVLQSENLPSAIGYSSTNVPSLLPRLSQVGLWLGKVSNQPAAVWWAAHQNALHPQIRRFIQWELDRSGKSTLPIIRSAWRYIFDAWDSAEQGLHRDWYDLRAQLDAAGWSSERVRKYAEVRRPRIEVGPDYWSSPKPPQFETDLRLRELLRVDVKYPDLFDDISVPDAWVAAVTSALRQNLELAVTLEAEIGSRGLSMFDPIVPELEHSDEVRGRGEGLSAAVREFATLFARLTSLDASRARAEYRAWPVSDDAVFSRLRMWAASKEEVVAADAFGLAFEQIGDVAFWDTRHQRDLLLALAARWNGLPQGIRELMERRLLSGPRKWEEEDDNDYVVRCATSVLERIHWLARNGCQFGFDLVDHTASLMRRAPLWRREYAEGAARSMAPRGGWVRTDTTHSALLKVPLAEVLELAKKGSGRGDELLIRNDPFAGLAVARPVRAFSALTLAGRAHLFPQWAWRTFLGSEARKSDSGRLTWLIAERLVRCPEQELATLLPAVSDWLSAVSPNLAVEHPSTFEALSVRLIGALGATSDKSDGDRALKADEIDWVMEAINAPTGKIVQAILNDARVRHLRVGEGFPASWLAQLDALLGLGGTIRRHTLVILFHRIVAIHNIDPKWTEAALLSALENGDDLDRLASIAGFLWRATMPSPELFSRIKPHLFALVTGSTASLREYGQVLAGLILGGWSVKKSGTGPRCIDNDEMRKVLLAGTNEFRSQVLWQLKEWSAPGKATEAEEWAVDVLEFLGRVWPKQTSARSPAVSARLFELAFSNEDRFPRVAALILPLLTRIEQDHITLPSLRKSGVGIIAKYPSETLGLLHAVLPDNVAAWPFEIELVLQSIASSAEALRVDPRMVRLMRLWDGR